MTEFDSFLAAISDATIEEKFRRPIDKARREYWSIDNRYTVETQEEFGTAIGRFWRFVANAIPLDTTRLTDLDAECAAGDVVDKTYTGGRATAIRHALRGTANGLQGVYDAIAQGISELETPRHISGEIDRVVGLDWDKHVEAATEILARLSPVLPDSPELRRPDRYAANCRELLHAFLEAREEVVHRMAAMLRRVD